MNKIFLWVLPVLLLVAGPIWAAPASEDLTEDMAAARARQITHLTYDLHFTLAPSGQTYLAQAHISFDLLRPNQSLSLDFAGEKLLSLSPNGKNSDSSAKNRWSGGQIHLAASELRSGPNTIEISYEVSPRTFHRYTDTDGTVYLYTQSEPFGAHRLFPCFDQPDLRASYTMTVSAPLDWQVISFSHPQSVKRESKRALWRFESAARFSPYLLEVAAGPFVRWSTTRGDLELNLYARRALKKNIEAFHADYFWLQTTKQGLDFFEKYFEISYPYEKLDQILVPNFGDRAMENIGAHTFSERYIENFGLTPEQTQARLVILHELVHDWLGNRVGIKWWDSLWLKEGLATFATTKAATQGLHDDGARVEAQQNKQRAYLQDSVGVLRPLLSPVRSAALTDTNLDSITYDKAAAFFRQIEISVGDEVFRHGLGQMLRRYDEANVSAPDLLRLTKKPKPSINWAWIKKWITTSGVSGLQALWECDTNGQISKLQLIESAPSANAHLRHHTRLGFFSFAGARPPETLAVEYEGPSTLLPHARGRACPDFINPNEGDEDYVRSYFAPEQLQLALDHFQSFDDLGKLQIFWAAINKIGAGQYPAPRFLDFSLKNMAVEKSSNILSVFFESLGRKNPAQFSFLDFLDENLQKDFSTKLETLALEKLNDQTNSTELRAEWEQFWLDDAVSPPSAERAKKMLSKTPEGDEKIKLMRLLARAGDGYARVWVSENRSAERDWRAAEVEVSLPELVSKRKWFDIFRQGLTHWQDSNFSDSVASREYPSLMAKVFDLDHRQITQTLSKDYFAALSEFDESAADRDYAMAFVTNLYPSTCKNVVAENTRELLVRRPNLSAPIRKALVQMSQLETLCSAAQERYNKGAK